MLLETPLMTSTDLEAQHKEGKLLELIHGRIVEKMPTQLHGAIAGQFVRRLLNHIDDYEIEGVAGVEVRHQMPNDPYNSRLPDVSFQYQHRDDMVMQGAVPQMPDIAIEIQSPNDSIDELREKMLYYLQNGTRLGWIAYPETQTIDVCTLVNEQLHVETLGMGDVLTGGEVLPHFRIPVAKIFPKKG
jgi:Uma2 family endonuclease